LPRGPADRATREQGAWGARNQPSFRRAAGDWCRSKSSAALPRVREHFPIDIQPRGFCGAPSGVPSATGVDSRIARWRPPPPTGDHRAASSAASWGATWCNKGSRPVSLVHATADRALGPRLGGLREDQNHGPRSTVKFPSSRRPVPPRGRPLGHFFRPGSPPLARDQDPPRPWTLPREISPSRPPRRSTPPST